MRGRTGFLWLALASTGCPASSSVKVEAGVPVTKNPLIVVTVDGHRVWRAPVHIVGEHGKTDYRTNFRGEVRPTGLAPGGYELTASYRNRWGSMGINVEEEPYTYSPTIAHLDGSVPSDRIELKLNQSAEKEMQAAMTNAQKAPVTHVRSFQGSVIDNSGARVSRAEIKMLQVRSGKLRRGISFRADATGSFDRIFPIGEYIAAFQAPGFRTSFLHIRVEKNAAAEPLTVQLVIGGSS